MYFNEIDRNFAINKSLAFFLILLSKQLSLNVLNAHFRENYV